MSEPQLLIQNIKNPKVTFRIVSFDPDTKLGILEGEYGGRFTRNLSKESLTTFGYRVVKADEAAPAPAPAARKKKA